MHITALIYVMLGGALGSLLRYISTVFISRLMENNFPYGTLAVNIIGSLLMGIWIAASTNLMPDRSRDLHLLFAVGVLGGFTTFSTFSLDVFYLFERGDYLQASGYAISSVLLSVFALMVGIFIVKVIL